jgi:hypothetical protein
MNYAEFNAMTFSAIETAHSSLRRDAEFDPWDDFEGFWKNLVRGVLNESLSVSVDSFDDDEGHVLYVVKLADLSDSDDGDPENELLLHLRD